MVGMLQDGHGLPDQLCRRIAEDALGRTADVTDEAAAVDHDDDIVGRLKYSSIQRFVLPQLRFDGFAPLDLGLQGAVALALLTPQERAECHGQGQRCGQVDR